MSKSTERSRGSKEQILSVACALFRSRGFEATTMREIADKANMAVGAAYYHFRSKDDLVFAYYQELQERSEQEVEEIRQSSRSASERLKRAVRFKFRQLEADRELTRALTRVAADPQNKLSPLSRETGEVRRRAIQMMSELMAGSDVRVGKALKAHIGAILWLYYLGMIFFWAHDRSEKQRRADALVDISAPLLIKLLSFSVLPTTGKINRSVANAVECVLGAAEEPGEQNPPVEDASL